MPKGFCATFAAAALLAVSFNSQAEVYRCETPSGVTFSDMPCGDGAEEIAVKGVVMDTVGVGGSEPAPVAPGSTHQATTGPDRSRVTAAPKRAPRPPTRPEPVAETQGVTDSQYLTDFLAMLKSQREEQMGQIDSQLQALRQRVENSGDTAAGSTYRDELMNQIAALETNRDSILQEYEALIAEAEARLE